MITNADITIYNKWYNQETRLDEWHRTEIHGVNWFAKQAVSVSDKGLLTADQYIVRIPSCAAPEDKEFVAPATYAAADPTDLPAIWTLQAGDYVTKGIADADIAHSNEITGERFAVIGWSDNRRGSPVMQHWRIDGK